MKTLLGFCFPPLCISTHGNGDVVPTVMLEKLQANQTLLFHLGLLCIGGRPAGRDWAFSRWGWRRVGGTGAAGRRVDRLVGGVIDKAVGPWLAAVLHTEGELCGGHGLVDAIYVHAECEGICRGDTKRSLPALDLNKSGPSMMLHFGDLLQLQWSRGHLEVMCATFSTSEWQLTAFHHMVMERSPDGRPRVSSSDWL